MKNIFIVRHAQSWGNVDPSIYFKQHDQDIEITDLGKSQARDAGIKITNLLYKYTANFEIYYSPYVRTVQSKNLIRNVLDEQHWEGSTIIERMSPLMVERYWGNLRDIVNSGEKNDGHFNFFYTPKDGESFATCYQRVVMFDLWFNQVSKMDNVVIVSHGEWIKLYLMYKFGWSLEEFQQYKTPRNGEVYWLKDGHLSHETPLTLKHK